MMAQPPWIPIYSGFWRRAGAFAVDGVIHYLLFVVALIAIAAAFVPLPKWIDQAAIPIVYIVVACAYYAGFHSSSRQATPGKAAMGIKVTSLAGERIGLGAAVVRYFGSWLSTALLMSGFVMAAFAPRKQALHDLAAKTLVVNARATPEQVRTGAGVMPITIGVVALMIIPIAAMGGLGVVAISAFHDYESRARVSGAIAEMDPVIREMGQALGRKEPFTAGVRPAEKGWLVKEFRVTADGAVTAVLAVPGVSGGSVTKTPTIEAGGEVTWRCASTGIPPSWVPAGCR